MPGRSLSTGKLVFGVVGCDYRLRSSRFPSPRAVLTRVRSQPALLQPGPTRSTDPYHHPPRPPPHLGHPRPERRHRHQDRQRTPRPQQHPHHERDLHPRDSAQRVICDICGRRTSIDTNDRGQRIYRCWNRGKGCRIPGRSANGLHRAARLGISELRNDDSLYDAIRSQLRGRIDRAGAEDAPASRSGAIAKLRNEREKLLSLYLDDKITSDYFAEKERRITTKIEGLEADHAESIEQVRRHSALADAFEQAATLLRDPAFDFDMIWEDANDKELRVLVEELIESITIHADRLEVTVTGAPPLLVNLNEVGLRDPGTGPVVSEG